MIGQNEIGALRQAAAGYWAGRILDELEYAVRLAEGSASVPEGAIADAYAYLHTQVTAEGAIGKAVALHAEELLAPVAPYAKQFKVLVTGHAHIDMNWQWGYHETVSVVINTFRTMLRLMEEYPSFRYSQSQAATYAIVEEYAPELLEPIRRRVQEGRWEVLGSAWVENDQNMAGEESLARQYLYSRRYLAGLLGIERDAICIDFHPDTFGHPQTIPSILQRAGIRYCYFSRGSDQENLFRWQAPDGSAVLAYREPMWYNLNDIDGQFVFYVPAFCRKNGIDTAFRMLGVGDHGGGPTRRDIERVLDFASWPIFPAIRFGSLREYYDILEHAGAAFPTVQAELNPVFTGCYTSQARIKAGNRGTENALYRAEAFAALSALETGMDYRRKAFERAWRRVLFNQFHDILPGSGVRETREYAMGQYQKAYADANAAAEHALTSLADTIDTTFFVPEEERLAVTDGAGVGYGSTRPDRLFTCEQGRGKRRLVHIFNPAPCAWDGPVEVTLWDYCGDAHHLCATDAGGRPVPCQVTEPEAGFWCHRYSKLLLDVQLPAFGYASYVVDQDVLPFQEQAFVSLEAFAPRVERAVAERPVLENERICARFDPVDFRLISLVDKASGTELLDAATGGRFQFIREMPRDGMTSWVVGRTVETTDIGRDGTIRLEKYETGTLRSLLQYRVSCGEHSQLTVCMHLDRGADALVYEVTCDWREYGDRDHGVPQLAFAAGSRTAAGRYRYQTPYGAIDRAPSVLDAVSLGSIAALSEDAAQLVLYADAKYGFRGTGDGVAVDLLRGSYDPDPYPENVRHTFRFALAAAGDVQPAALAQRLQRFELTPVALPGTRHTGVRAPSGCLLSVEGAGTAVTAVKLAEDDPRRLIVKLYEADGARTRVTLRPAGRLLAAHLLDNDETVLSDLSTADGAVTAEVPAHSLLFVGLDIAE